MRAEVPRYIHCWIYSCGVSLSEIVNLFNPDFYKLRNNIVSHKEMSGINGQIDDLQINNK